MQTQKHEWKPHQDRLQTMSVLVVSDLVAEVILEIRALH